MCAHGVRFPWKPEATDPPELELQEVGSHLMWTLGTELGPLHVPHMLLTTGAPLGPLYLVFERTN